MWRFPEIDTEGALGIPMVCLPAGWQPTIDRNKDRTCVDSSQERSATEATPASLLRAAVYRCEMSVKRKSSL
jgi:hypothetical protein